jgi:hypothetical protein
LFRPPIRQGWHIPAITATIYGPHNKALVLPAGGSYSLLPSRKRSA